jgi:flagellar hook-associated protein 3 FlgL
MRIATRSVYLDIQQRIMELSSSLKKLNEKLSSGKNISRPSDDPIALINSLGLKTSLSQIEQYDRNIKTGESWLNLSESALSQILDIVGRAREITVQAANDTQTAETRANTATEVGHLLDQAIALGNTKLGGSYIFAGYHTQTTPFTKATLGGIETAQYNGDTNDFQIQIGKDERITVGKNGQTVLMDSDLFDTLGTLKRALETNDRDTISQQLDALEGVQDYLNNQIADVGARANRLDGKKEVLSNLNLSLTESLSNVEDSDYSEVIVELKEKELAYQAALASAVRITELSILNYLS